jgi:hypothetical protein
MANYSSGTQWGEFIKGVDPGRSFADTFLQGFRESIAYKLAEKQDKLNQQMEQQKQKALEDYRNLQMMVKQMEMKEAQKQQALVADWKRKEWESGAGQRQLEQGIFDKMNRGETLTEQEQQYMKFRGTDQEMTPYQRAQLELQWAKFLKTKEDDKGKAPKTPTEKFITPEGNTLYTDIVQIGESVINGAIDRDEFDKLSNKIKAAKGAMLQERTTTNKITGETTVTSGAQDYSKLLNVYNGYKKIIDEKHGYKAFPGAVKTKFDDQLQRAYELQMNPKKITAANTILRALYNKYGEEAVNKRIIELYGE